MSPPPTPNSIDPQVVSLKRSCTTHAPQRNGDQKASSRLSLRWAVILVAAAGAGLGVGAVAGIPAGVVAACSVATACHMLIR